MKNGALEGADPTRSGGRGVAGCRPRSSPRPSAAGVGSGATTLRALPSFTGGPARLGNLQHHALEDLAAIEVLDESQHIQPIMIDGPVQIRRIVLDEGPKHLEGA